MKSLIAQAAIAAMRPLDRQFSRLTNFELEWVRTRGYFYINGKPIAAAEAASMVAHIAEHLHIRPPKICRTKRREPYCMPWGKVKSIYLAPAHRQPYLIAHEVAHAATGTTGHPPAFMNRYLDALVSIGGFEPVLRGTMREYGITI